MTDTAATKPDMSTGAMLFKLATELGPLGVFFFANARGEWLAEQFPFLAGFGEPIFIATALFMVATAISLTASKIVLKRIPVMPLVTAVFVFVMGGLTLYLQDDLFIKMKPTIVNLTFAVILLGGLYAGRLLIKYVFGEVIQLHDEGWRQLTIRWSLFFIFLAILNEFIWRTFSTDTWVAFKTFGIMPITMIFTVAQLGLLQKYQIISEPAENQNS